jgi:Glyoxalase-like domain
VELDHVLIPVADLSGAVKRFEARYGLVSVEGGRHAGWGTANRIVPLGETYLELVAVVDQKEAEQSAFGRWVAAAPPGAPLGWAVRTDDLDAVVARLGLSIGSGARRTSTGELLRWRIAGVEQSMIEPALPFFIEWASETRFPGAIGVAHPAAPKGITELIIEADHDRLASWLGRRALPLTVRPGGCCVSGVVLSTQTGEVIVSSGSR